jgi:hypothetical protein
MCCENICNANTVAVIAFVVYVHTISTTLSRAKASTMKRYWLLQDFFLLV